MLHKLLNIFTFLCIIVSYHLYLFSPIEKGPAVACRSEKLLCNYAIWRLFHNDSDFNTFKGDVLFHSVNIFF